MAEFVANNYVNMSTRITLFFADNGFHSCMDIKPPQTYQSANRKAKLLAADKIVANQNQMAIFLQDQLAWAQQEQIH